MARDITIKYVGDSSSAERAARRVNEANKKIEGGFGSVAKAASEKFRSVGRSLTSAGRSMTTFATLPIAAGFGLSIKAASDLNEQTSKMETVFKDQAPAIAAFGRNAAKNIGLSTTAAFEATGTFGNMFSQLGIAPDVTAAWSQSLTLAAGDLASFHNADITQVIEAQTSAFRGEYDALQRFIPTINAANVQQLAMEQTGKANAKQLTEGEKAAAAYTLMMEGMGEAQGDFARTSDSAANKQRILQAQFQNLTASIGQQLLPIAMQFGAVLADLLDRFNKLSPTVRKFVLIGLGLLAVMGPVVGAIGAVATAISLLISPVGLIIVAIAALAIGAVYAYKNFEGFRNVVDGVVRWVTGTAIPAFTSFAEGVVDKFQELVAWVRVLWPQISEAISHVMNVIAGIVRTVLDVVQKAWRLFGDDILTFVKATWDGIRQQIKGAMQVISGVIKLVLAIINGDWGKAWDAIKQIFEGVWNIIIGLLKRVLAIIQLVLASAYSAIQNAASVAWNWVKTKISTIWEGIKTGVSNAATWVKNKVGGIWDSIKTKTSNVWTGIKNAVSGVWTGIKSAVRNGVNGVIGVVNGLIRGVNAIIRKLPGDVPTIPTITPIGGGGSNVRGGTPGGRRPTGRKEGGTIPFVTDGPRAIVGEGNRAFPEYVIPTDPKYRGRAMALFDELGPKLMAAGGVIPGFARGGIPNPIKAIGGAISDVGDMIRKGAALAFFAPINELAKKAINALPWAFARGVGHSLRQKLYDFVKGEDDKLQPAGGGSAPRGSGVAGLREPLASRVAAILGEARGQVYVVSGWRSSAQQARLYDRWRRGVPGQAQAAPPGRSKHEQGLAVDWGGNRAMYRSLSLRHGLYQPMSFEPWHWQVPGYQNGTNFVPNDGLAFLHRGEAVVPAMSGTSSSWLGSVTESRFMELLTRLQAQAGDRIIDAVSQSTNRIVGSVTGLDVTIRYVGTQLARTIVHAVNLLRGRGPRAENWADPMTNLGRLLYLRKYASLNKFHGGGEVPGMPGEDVLALLRAGEYVIPAGQRGTSRSTQNVYVTINVQGGDPEATVTALKRYMRSNGPVPIRVRG